MTGTLHDVRAAIDQIDDELLHLICRRMALSAEVAKAKSGAVTYRPGREADPTTVVTNLKIFKTFFKTFLAHV